MSNLRHHLRLHPKDKQAGKAAIERHLRQRKQEREANAAKLRRNFEVNRIRRLNQQQKEKAQ